uniref:KH homology domain-containing protein 4 n=1 Tax=Amphimedon queenslandica TaxID=400682 RepID=A0A1X7TKY4_AMPQE
MADEPVKKKRRSKWDQPAAPPDDTNSSASTSDKVDPSVSAACAAARINAMLEAKGKINKMALDVSTSNVGVSKEVPPAEIEINDSEARGILTKGPTLSEISRGTGAAVSVRGRYMTPAEKANSTTDDRPLYLSVQAPNQSFINAAVQKIRNIMYQSECGSPNNLLATKPHLPIKPTSSIPPTSVHHYIQDKVFIGLDDVDNSFGLLDRLQGPDGSYLSHIASTTGAKVFLRGKGSKYIEPTSGKESFEALYLFISHPSSDGVMSARKLCENLIEHVKSDYDGFMMSKIRNPYNQPHPQAHLYPPHGYAPPPHPPPTHPNYHPVPPPHHHGHFMEHYNPSIPGPQPRPLLMPQLAPPTSFVSPPQAIAHTPNHFPQVVPDNYIHEPLPPHYYGGGPCQPLMGGTLPSSHAPPPPPHLVDPYQAPPTHGAPPTYVAPAPTSINDDKDVLSKGVEHLAYHQLPHDSVDKILPKRKFTEQANGRDDVPLKTSKLSPPPPPDDVAVKEDVGVSSSSSAPLDVLLMPPPHLPPPSSTLLSSVKKQPLTTNQSQTDAVKRAHPQSPIPVPIPPQSGTNPLSVLKNTSTATSAPPVQAAPSVDSSFSAQC